MHHLARLEVPRQRPAVRESGNDVSEPVSHGGWPGDQALRRDEPLCEQVTERRGSLGALDVDEFVAQPEQVADLQAAARPERIPDARVPVQAQQPSAGPGCGELVVLALSLPRGAVTTPEG